jgi:hypothetical protein
MLRVYLVEEGVSDSQYDSGQGRAVTGGHLFKVRVVDGVEGTIIRHKPYNKVHIKIPPS